MFTYIHNSNQLTAKYLGTDNNEYLKMFNTFLGIIYSTYYALRYLLILLILNF